MKASPASFQDSAGAAMPDHSLSSGGALINDEPPRRNSLIAILLSQKAASFGALVLAAMVVMALAAPILPLADPLKLAPAARLRPPSSEFWFGTDMLGRDLFSRVVNGARVSLLVGFSVAALASVIGLAFGVVAGFVRWTEAIIMRIMDGMMSIPPILLAIALMALMRGSVINVITAIVLAEVPRVARLVRSAVLTIREQAFVEAAVSLGTRQRMIIVRHVLPNAAIPLIVQATYIFGSAIITESVLSFIGAGTPPTTPSWGNIMAEGRALWQIRPSIIFFPAAFLSLTVLAINLLGDGLRDLLDPKLAARSH